MTAPASVRRFLDASPGHLPPHVYDNLSAYDGVTAYRLPVGWFLWVPDDPTGHAADYGTPLPSDQPHTSNEYDEDDGSEYDGVPLEAVALQEFARQRGCDYVLLDDEAATVPGLAVFERPDR